MSFGARLGALLLVAVLSLTGCNDDDAPDDDAGGDAAADATADAMLDATPDGSQLEYDDSCAQALWPISAPTHLRFSGVVRDVSDVAVVGATIAIRDRQSQSLSGSGTTDAAGAYDVQADLEPAGVVTGGNPIDGLIVVTSSGAVSARLKPSSPFAADDTGRVIVLRTPGELESFYTQAGDTLGDEEATVWVRVVDCAGTPIAGMTVSVDAPQASVVVLDADGTPIQDTTVTDSAGRVVVLGVPSTVTALKVQAAAGGQSLRTQLVGIAPTTEIHLELRP